VTVIPPDDVVERLVRWGAARKDVRAMILTSSRARPDGPVDALSDFDVVLGATDPAALAADTAWTEDYGRALVRWGDESERLGVRTYFRGVVYEDGAKIDWSLWPVELLERVAAGPLPEQLDVGYRVLLDKDGRTAGWAPPTHRAHIPAPPTEAEYRALVEEFWWGATYVAKSLWRGELVFTKFLLDYDLTLVTFRRMLEWRVELDHDWSLKPGAYGRGLDRVAPGDAAELLATHAGPAPEENWQALARTAAHFRRVAREVGERLGYRYPQEVDDGVSAYVEGVRRLAPPG
jgi:aminoglycoside 6-adenylyltransferase